MDPHQLLGAYVLGAVGDDERRDFERHLGRCDACWDEMPSLVRAAGRLAAVRPPAPR